MDMKKLFVLLLTTWALIGAASCSDGNDGEGNHGEVSLVGLWEVTAEYDGEYQTWDYEFGAQYGYTSVMEFKADGTGYQQDTDGALVEKDGFRYTLDNGVISIVTDDGEKGAFRIDKLTVTELILAQTYQSNGNSYTDLLVCKRVR